MTVSHVPGDKPVAQPSYLESPAYQNLLPAEKDSLTQSLSTDELNARFPTNIGAIPLLIPPEKKIISLQEYFSSRTEVKLAVSDTLREAEQAELALRRLSSESAALQAQALIEAIDARNAALAQLQQNVKEIEELLRQILETMEVETKQQKELTDKINAGNSQEQQLYNDLSKAYDDYMAELKKIGVVDKGNGQYEIPPGKEQEFNEATAKYQGKVDSFNKDWAKREQELNDYNAKTMVYNQKVKENNQALDDLLAAYGLTGLRERLDIPYQKQAATRDLSNYSKIEAPGQVQSAPATVTVSPLPTYVKAKPPTLAGPGTYPSMKEKDFATPIYNQLYASQIAPLDQQIAFQVQLLELLRIQNIYKVKEDISFTPDLNTKPLIAKLLPETNVIIHERINSQNAGMIHSLTPTIELADPKLEEILGSGPLKQLLKEFFPDLSEAQIKQLVNQLLVFSVSQLNNNSLQALFPSLSLISSALLTLPKDSPVLTALFAISFANRVQEMAQIGLINESLETFTTKIPQLSRLKPEQKVKLAAALNVGQLLIATKLLEANLGLPGLTAQIVAPLMGNERAPLLQKAAQESKQEGIELHQSVKDTFVAQGYPQETAHFLADVAAEILDAGLATPTAISIPSEKSVNVPLLTDSIQASLLLANGPEFPIEQAREIATETVSHALAETPMYSTNQFRESLAQGLKDFGFKANVTEIVRDAVIIPPKETALLPEQSAKTNRLESAEKPSTPAPAPALSQADLIKIVKTRVHQQIEAQLGTKLAEQVTQEVAKTLFGNPEPGAERIEETLSPFSLVGTLRNESSKRKAKDEGEFTIARHEDFKESIKESVNLHAFLLKLQDPLAIYSHIGLMYERGGGKQKSVFV